MFNLATSVWIAFLCTGLTAADGTSPSADLIDEFDVAADGDVIVLPVLIEGKEYAFALDTGSSETIYDSPFTPRLGPSRGTQVLNSPNGKIKAERFRPLAGRLGSQDLPTDHLVAVINLDLIRRGSGHPIRGILGMDFLRRCIIRFDPNRGKLSFLKSASDEFGLELPIAYNEKQIPVVSTEVPGWGELSFRVDTGRAAPPSGDIDTRSFNYLLDRNLLRGCGAAETFTASGTSRERVGMLNSISIAELPLSTVAFCESRGSALGMGFWCRFVVTFDFRNNCLYLQKSRRFEAHDRPPSLGIGTFLVDGSVRTARKITSVVCPAW
jgi:hypothetical protein